MGPDTTIEVVDPNGWRKEYHLEKTIVFIGSGPGNDISLEAGRGAGVSPRHLQLICMPDAGCRLVNLGETEIFLGEAGDQAVAPRLSAELGEGTQIRLGEFILIFHGGELLSNGARQRREGNIGLSLALPHTRLAPNRSVEGVVTVSNLGDRTGVQFDLELEGIDPDCFDLEPGPLLSSGAEKEVLVRLHHRGERPLAGQATITIWAVAPRAYPAEEATVSQVITILPYYQHKLTVTPPPEVQKLLEPEQPPPVTKVESPEVQAPSGLSVKKSESEAQLVVTEKPRSDQPEAPVDRTASLAVKETEVAVTEKPATTEPAPATEAEEEAVSKKGGLFLAISRLFRRSRPEAPAQAKEEAFQEGAEQKPVVEPQTPAEPGPLDQPSPEVLELQPSGTEPVQPVETEEPTWPVAEEAEPSTDEIDMPAPVESPLPPAEPALPPPAEPEPPVGAEESVAAPAPEAEPPPEPEPAVEPEVEPEPVVEPETEPEKPDEPVVEEESALSEESLWPSADPPQREEQARPIDPEAEVWWETPAETQPESNLWDLSGEPEPASRIQEKQVIKLKAKRSPRGEPQEEERPASRSQTEDWWAVEAPLPPKEDETETETGSDRSEPEADTNGTS